MKQEKQDEQFLFVEKVMRNAQRHEREQKRSAIQSIPESRLLAPTSSPRAPHVLPKRPMTGSLDPESTSTTPDLGEGGVSLTTRPPTQRDQMEEEKNLRDVALAARLEEENKKGTEKPETILNP